MKDVAEKLQPFIEGHPPIKIVADEYVNEVVDAQTGDVYGEVDLEEGRLISYQKMELEDAEQPVYADAPPAIDNILNTAQLFVDTFVSRDVRFSMLNEWGENQYMVTYEERDPKLGIPLPHTGCMLHFTRNGLLTSANIGQTEYELEYPTVSISPEKAKQILREAKYVQLALQAAPLEEAESDPVVELVYRPNHEIMAIGVDGKIETFHDFMQTEEVTTQKIAPVSPNATVEEMLGVNESYVKEQGEEGSVIFVDSAANVEDEDEALISISSEEMDYFSFSNVPFVTDDYSKPLAMTDLTHKALEYLELVEKNIDDLYVLEEPTTTEDPQETYEEEFSQEDSETEYEDDLYLEVEPTQMFTFYREHDGYRLDGMESYVHVGLYTGIIRECSIRRLSVQQATELQKLDTTPAISLEQATETIFNEIELRLVRSVKEFDQTNVYTLSYIVDFPKTGCHIEKINAHTGDVRYVDTGILMESDE
ncbi:hypothetical protein [Bacillus sp. FJAT-45037]|uniref:hypothetical protein n=1 Tax=Bacillus sp. FJAT-45037 TaxID=2011007 RepID=UPI000C247E98|nr:hypothetical protein [Bacillus sp. FJAT-45037]